MDIRAIEETREQIMEDLDCYLDGADEVLGNPDLMFDISNIIVKNFDKLIKTKSNWDKPEELKCPKQ